MGVTSIYATSGDLWAYDSYAGNSRLTSHEDPRNFDPTAQSSFGDLAIRMPFSFHHYNRLVGKGQVVDMAKMVAFVEGQMRTQMGEQAGKLVYDYDLPTSQSVTLAQWNQSAVEEQTRMVLDKLNTMPWVKVGVGANGEIPAEVFEEAPETRMETRIVNYTEKAIDYETMRLIDVNRTKEVQEAAPTGRTIRHLKSGYELRADGIYRKPTVSDVDLNAIIGQYPQLPRWILDRIQSGQSASAGVDDIINQIRAALEKTIDSREMQQMSSLKP